MVNKHRVDITQDSAVNATVLIDGNPIQDAVRSFTFAAGVGQVPGMTISLIPGGFTYAGEAIVSVTPLTRDLLMSLGWTPPGEAGRPCSTRGCGLLVHDGPHVPAMHPLGEAGPVELSPEDFKRERQGDWPVNKPRLGHDGSDRWTGGDKRDAP